MSDQQTPPNDTPQEDAPPTSQPQSQNQSSSNPMQRAVDTVGNIWNKGSSMGLAVKDSDSQTMFTLPVNIILLLFLALLINFVPAVIVLVIVGLVAQFVYKASFSFGKLDNDVS
jgi:hypothetical protein